MGEVCQRPLAITPAEGWGISGAIVLSLVVLLVALYLFKNRTGSQQWRVRIPMAIQRIFGFGWWLVFKKFPWKPVLIWGPWVGMILGVGFYAFENWRGKRAWEKVEEELRARGESLVFEDYLPPVPDEENVLMHPEVIRLLGDADNLEDFHHAGIEGIVDFDQDKKRRSWREQPKPRTGISPDIRTWLKGARPDQLDEDVARELLLLAEDHWEDLDVLAVAMERPRCRFLYGNVRWYDVSMPDGLMALVGWSVREYQTRALLFARAGEGEKCAADLQNLRKLPVKLISPDFAMASVLYAGLTVAHGSTLWEALRLHVLAEEELFEIEQDLADIDLFTALSRTMKMERCLIMEGLTELRNDRKKAVRLMTPYGAASAPGSSFSDWKDWVIDQWGEVEIRCCPRGWYDRIKARKGRDYRLGIDALESGDPGEVGRYLVAREERLSVFDDYDTVRGMDAVELRVDGATPVVMARVVEVLTWVAMQRAAVAVERFYLKNNAYPSTPVEVVPEFLSEWPVDATNGEPLGYELKPDGTPRFYSTGPDGERDTSDDQVWQYTAEADEKN